MNPCVSERCPRQRFTVSLLGVGMLLTALCGVCRGQEANSIAPVIELDARDASAGTDAWSSGGRLTPFRKLGAPKVQTVAGAPAVVFDGLQDAYRGPQAPAELTGGHARTIEVWVLNPSIDADEETLVCWGKRGGQEGTLMAFSYGRSPGYGAVAHWASDMGWRGAPEAGRWHQLVYTYDGVTARIYDNTALKNRRKLALNTAPGTAIDIAVQNGADGAPQFKNEYNQSSLAGSLAIASVRIYAVALTPDQIAERFHQEAERFHAVAAPSPLDLLKAGTQKLETRHFTLTLLRATQTAVSLSPRDATPDFLPGDRMEDRQGDHYYYLGDITFRARTGNGPWKSYSSAVDRKPVQPSSTTGALAACDLTPQFGADCPVAITRQWCDEGGDLVLRFQVTNRTPQTVDLGAFGAAMVFNNLLTNRSLEEAHDQCVFADPSLAGDAGYLQVTRLNGKGPALLVLPEHSTPFEAYRPLKDDPTPRDVTFEGFYEWMVHTRAYAENEWKGVTPWNPPTSRTLAAGESVTYGFRFVLASGIRQIEQTLMAHNRPVVVGVPGYVLATDQMARLFVHSASPLLRIRVEPQGALVVVPDATPTAKGWRRVTLSGKQVGRSRLTLLYGNGMQQSIHYNVIPPEAQQIKRLGAFHATKQWFTDPTDPFGRTFSFLPYNRETNSMVLQHPNSWFVGLSDEIGAGASVAMAMKNLWQPDAGEIALLEKYVNTALWGKLQNRDYGVRAGLFYYDPARFPGYYTVHGGWDKARTETTWRAFNYPHVAAVYWSLYRLARYHQGLVKMRPWQWYLSQSYHTVMAIQTHAADLAQFGLMLGSGFVDLIHDLRREGWNAEANLLEAYMRQRADHWRQLRYPFGSEMPWDSTGQEEIYTWCRYFGFADKAQTTVDAVTGYMPTVPNWAYNGAARRYFDAPVNGTRWPEIVRMTNHYGPAINAIPVLSAYRDHPDDFHLLRIGYAGMDCILANIDAQGFASYGFDADPEILQFDPYTADYGIAFYGYAVNAGAYLVHHPEFGWLGFGGEVKEEKGTIRITPRDAFRRQVYLAPLGVRLTLDAGTFESITYVPAAHSVRILLPAATSSTPTAFLRLERPTTEHGKAIPFTLSPAFPTVRGAFAIPLQHKETALTLVVPVRP